MTGKTLGHYRILSKLGAGGMGEVYEAEDTRLKRRVALKVLSAELAGDPVRRERFQREAEAVAALDHPNIVTIHSIESAGSAHFFTMQLVQGKTLDELVPDEGLAFETWLEVAVSLADALRAAHDAGITHRDLKPRNIMVGDDSRVRVLDFGIAKIGRSEPEDVQPEATRTFDVAGALTGDGMVVGTAPYMSPEQVKGLAVDPRSDVFSLGAVLYEMACGSRPFTGKSTAEVMSAVLRDMPEPLCEPGGRVPASVGRIVERCLEKSPVDRYQHGGELHRDLDKLRATATAPRVSTSTSSTSLTLPVRPSLAVLPFVNLSGDPEQDYFATGLWHDINTDLVKISGLFLISPGTTGLYKDKDVGPVQVGRELGVRHVLEGTVRRAGNRVRITARLIDTKTAQPVWAERYDRTIEDLFELQDEINEEIVTALDVKLLHGEGHRIMRRSLKNPAARDAYYKALAALFTFRRDPMVEARHLLADVTELEPDSPLADVFTAFVHYFEGQLGLSDSPEESARKALELAEKAIEKEDPTGTAYMIKGMSLLARGEHEAALEAAEHATVNRPSCPWAYALKGAAFNFTGRPAEAIEMARVAIRHTPLFPPVFASVLAVGHYLMGQHGAAIEAARGTLELAPDNLEAHVTLAAALAAAGRAEDAEATCREILRIKPDFLLENYFRSQPFRDPSTVKGLTADLRTAGLS